MHEDHRETATDANAQESGEDYIAPALTDLGSFEELTRLNPGPMGDSEGTS